MNAHRVVRITMVCALLMPGVIAAQPLPLPKVSHESEVFTLVPPGNGSGPLWSYGCTQIARINDTVYVSAMETGEAVPKLCNTRWRLMQRDGDAWRVIAEDDRYRQREPCPIAVLPPSRLILNVNDSTEPPGTEYGTCTPLLRVFDFQKESHTAYTIDPQWRGVPYFTDHSYRGFAADPHRGRLVMLNIDAHTSIQHACLVSATGETLATGMIEFPIRSCYPQVALDDFAVYVLAIGDIVEPVDEWREYKFNQTQQQWDYVFRRLFFTYTPDLRESAFISPVEIDNVEATCGHITNQDLWMAPDGDAWILYTRREVQHALMRDKFFPDKSIQNALCLARINAGKIVEKRVLLPECADRDVSQAKFHPTPDGALYVVLHLTGAAGGNKLMRLLPQDADNTLVPIPVQTPLYWFCLATVRAGNAPSSSIDMFGADGNTYRYAEIQLQMP